MPFRRQKLLRSKLLSRFIVLFAFLHTMAPAMASVADAWTERGASHVIQVGEPGSANYLRAHPDDCALCVASAAVTGTGEARSPLPAILRVRQTPVAFSEVRRIPVARHVASQRAPPALS